MFEYIINTAIKYYNTEVFDLMDDYNWSIMDSFDLSEWLKSRIGYGFSTDELVCLILDMFDDYNYNVSEYQYDTVRFKADENIANLYDRIFG